MSARVRPLAAITVVGVLVLTGCGGFDASKSGGGAEPIHVRLASGDSQARASSTAVETFAREIERRSGGSMDVDISWQSFLGDERDDPNALNTYRGATYSEVARQVQDDEVELAIVPDFAWIDRGSRPSRRSKCHFSSTRSASCAKWRDESAAMPSRTSLISARFRSRSSQRPFAIRSASGAPSRRPKTSQDIGFGRAILPRVHS